MSVIEHEAMKMAATYGIFALLFVALLFYVLRENAKREQSYQSIISDLSQKFEIVHDIKEDVKEIKKKLYD